MNRTGCLGRAVLPTLVLLAACAPAGQPVEIPFVVRHGDATVACNAPVGGLRLTDLRFFVHDLAFVSRDGEAVPIRLDEAPPWQGSQVALLDFEDGGGACRNGSAVTNATVRGFAPAGDYEGLRFRVGVPGPLNHADPLRAPPPLDLSAMHWHWLTGYKFLRAGVESEGRGDGFWIHLGSSRCEGTAADPRGCRHPNRPQVSLPEFRGGESVVVIDLAALAGAADLGDGVPTDCSSGPAEAACEAPFGVLGLDFATGRPGGTQALFRVGRVE